MRLILSFALVAALLTACGFQPIYADRSGNIQSALAGVEVTPITDPPRVGYQLQQELDQRFGEGEETRYALDIRLSERRDAVAVTRSADTVRFNYELRARYTLRDTRTGEEYEGRKETFASYGIVSSQYSSLVAQEDAIRKAAIDLADQIELDLVLYLRNQDDQ